MSTSKTDLKEIIEEKKDETADNKAKTGKKGKKEEDKKMVSSFRELEEELNDPAIFLGTIAYLQKLKEYKENPNKDFMALEEFKKNIEDFKKHKMYKTGE